MVEQNGECNTPESANQRNQTTTKNRFRREKIQEKEEEKRREKN